MDVNVSQCDKESDNTCVSLPQFTELQISRWNMILSGVLVSKPRSIKPDFRWDKWHSWQQQQKKKVRNSKRTNLQRLHLCLCPFLAMLAMLVVWLWDVNLLVKCLDWYCRTNLPRQNCLVLVNYFLISKEHYQQPLLITVVSGLSSLRGIGV